jgi:hypothetical protein
LPYLFKLDKPNIDLDDTPAASPADFKVGMFAAVVFTAKVSDKDFNYNSGKGMNLKVMTVVLVSRALVRANSTQYANTSAKHVSIHDTPHPCKPSRRFLRSAGSRLCCPP